MVSLKKKVLLNILTFTLLIFTISCSSLNLFEDNKFFYKNGYQRVQLHSENENVINSHPVKIDPLRIEGALKLILTKYGPKTESLFQENKILAYSVAISDALIEAKPNQDVVFTLEGWYKGKALSNNLVTGGRIFYNKNGLNIIFGSVMRRGNLSETDPMLSHGVNPDLKKNPYAPGSRYQSIKSKYVLSTIPNSGVFRPKEAKGRVDWLVFTPKALTARSDLTFDQKKYSTASNFQVQGLRSELNTLKNELRNIKQNQYNNYNSGYGNYMPRQRYNVPTQPYGYYPNQNYQYPTQQNTRVNQQAPNNNRQISLKSLESMRQRGLISEETYIKKVQELGY